MDYGDLEARIEELEGKVSTLKSGLYFLTVCVVFVAGIIIAFARFA